MRTIDSAIDLCVPPLSDDWLLDPCSIFYSLAKELPGEDVWLDTAVGQLLLVQSSESANRVLLNKDRVFDKYFGAHYSVFGLSRLTANGDAWRKLRDLSQPKITSVTKENVFAISQLQYRAAVNRLLAKATRQCPVEMDEDIDYAAAATIAELVLGIDVETLGPDFLTDLKILFSLTAAMNWQDIDLEHPQNVETLHQVKLRIQKCRSKLAEIRPQLISQSPFIDDLAHSDCDDLDFANELITLLVAGYETTASAICWALQMLARATSEQNRIRAQLLEIPDPIGLDDLDKIPALQAVAQEALRMFPPVPVVGRVANSETQIAKNAIQAGQRVLVSIIAVNQNSGVFENPLSFDFNRFAGTGLRQNQPMLKSFGSGNRVCPGQQIALVEIVTALAEFLRLTNIRVANQKLAPFSFGVSLRRKSGHSLELHPVSR